MNDNSERQSEETEDLLGEIRDLSGEFTSRVLVGVKVGNLNERGVNFVDDGTEGEIQQNVGEQGRRGEKSWGREGEASEETHVLSHDGRKYSNSDDSRETFRTRRKVIGLQRDAEGSDDGDDEAVKCVSTGNELGLFEKGRETD